MDVAFRLLARRARSEAEMAAELGERGASRSLVRGVLGRLKTLGYIDDRRLAAECAERWKERGFGEYRIREQLRRARIEERVADAVTFPFRDERERARRELERHFDADEVADRRGIARAARFLAGRGFPPEVIDSLFDLWE
jgi:regulatory protein